MLPVDELPTDALLLGQLRSLGWHVGCYALGFIHRVLASRQKAQVSPMEPDRIKPHYWLAVWVPLKVLPDFEPRQKERF